MRIKLYVNQERDLEDILRIESNRDLIIERIIRAIYGVLPSNTQPYISYVFDGFNVTAEAGQLNIGLGSGIALTNNNEGYIIISCFGRNTAEMYPIQIPAPLQEGIYYLQVYIDETDDGVETRYFWTQNGREAQQIATYTRDVLQAILSEQEYTYGKITIAKIIVSNSSPHIIIDQTPYKLLISLTNILENPDFEKLSSKSEDSQRMEYLATNSNNLINTTAIFMDMLHEIKGGSHWYSAPAISLQSTYEQLPYKYWQFRNGLAVSIAPLSTPGYYRVVVSPGEIALLDVSTNTHKIYRKTITTLIDFPYNPRTEWDVSINWESFPVLESNPTCLGWYAVYAYYDPILKDVMISLEKWLYAIYYKELVSPHGYYKFLEPKVKVNGNIAYYNTTGIPRYDSTRGYFCKNTQSYNNLDKDEEGYKKRLIGVIPCYIIQQDGVYKQIPCTHIYNTHNYVSYDGYHWTFLSARITAQVNTRTDAGAVVLEDNFLLPFLPPYNVTQTEDINGNPIDIGESRPTQRHYGNVFVDVKVRGFGRQPSPGINWIFAKSYTIGAAVTHKGANLTSVLQLLEESLAPALTTAISPVEYYKIHKTFLHSYPYGGTTFIMPQESRLDLETTRINIPILLGKEEHKITCGCLINVAYNEEYTPDQPEVYATSVGIKAVGLYDPYF